MKNLLITLAILLLSPALLFGGDEILPLAQVKPGMKGTAKTVFSGTQIEEFGIEVLDIVKNFYPQRDVILVRLTGERVRETGVVGGMSGSPVYIEGKLVGALALRFGVFQKEPIAGVMPIEGMLEILGKEERRDQELPSTRGGGFSYWDAAFGLKNGSAKDVILEPLQGLVSRRSENTFLSPIRLPLVFSGFRTEVVQACEPILTNLGFVAIQGGNSPRSDTASTEPILPGSAVSEVLLDGDMGIELTGTVTWREGNKILAFGHGGLEGGAVSLPLGRARILTTLSSLMSSEKFPLMTEIIGTVRQDRTTGLLGVLGEKAEMIPVQVHCISSSGEQKIFRFRIAQERTLNPLTPFFLRAALINALESGRLAGGDFSLAVQGQIHFENKAVVKFDNFYSSIETPGFFSPMSDVLAATNDIASVVAALMMNDFPSPNITQVELSFRSIPGKKSAKIESLWYDKTTVRPGETVTLILNLQPYQGKRVKLVQPIQIPETITENQVTILVGSGPSISQAEQRVAPQKFRPQNFGQLVELLNMRRRNNLLYIQTKIPDQGALVEGKELPELPPSILAVMDSKKTSGNSSLLRERVLQEKQLPVDYALSGSKSIRIKVSENK